MQVTQKLTTPNVTQKLTTLNLCKEAVIQKFPEVFNGIGLHKTIQAKLIVDMSVTPIAQKPRKIPYNLTRLAQKEEDRLLEAGIIEKVPDDMVHQPSYCTQTPQTRSYQVLFKYASAKHCYQKTYHRSANCR